MTLGFAAIGGCSCGGDDLPGSTADPGVVFTYPADGQLDVPIGTRIVVAFSDAVEADALGTCSGSGSSVSGAFCVVGPDGPVTASAAVTPDGRAVELTGGLEPGTTYEVYVRSELSPSAVNLPSGALVTFTTRTERPRAVAPTLVAINGSSVEAFSGEVGALRPFFETSTIRLVFSEPLDARSIVMGPGAFELIDTSSGVSVPAAILGLGIHVSIDPVDDLIAGNTYELRLGGLISDLGGDPLTAAPITLTPTDSLGSIGPINQVLRTRGEGDPGPATTRAGAPSNVVHMIKPLIGEETISLQDGAVAAELGDPSVLGGPIAFTIRAGERLTTTGIDVQLGGEIPAGLSTGEIEIQFLTDANGRLYRSPFQSPDQVPDNERALIYVDLTFDIAITARDPIGNAALSQTVLGIQATGTAIATDGVLAIETVASMDMSLLGVTKAPSNMVMELITDAAAEALPDRNSPTLVATFPTDGADDVPVGVGLELTFDEPLDLERLRSGAVVLEDGGGGPVAASFEQHGSVIVVRPLARLDYDATYAVVASSDATDVAGNSLGAGGVLMSFSTPALENTDVGASLLAVHPGAPCALTSGSAASPGRCDFGLQTDDLYSPFELPANQDVLVELSQPLDQSTVVLSGQCDSGQIRVEELDSAGGNCIAPVSGTFLRRERGFSFIPDQPWQAGTSYRLALVSGNDEDCDNGELCGANGIAASFDVLDGTEDNDAGGEDMIVDFVGAAASEDTFVMAAPGPFTDLNGSGFVEGAEVLRDDNRAALRIASFDGAVSAASFDMEDCLPETPEVEGCMYIYGAMPVAMGELERDCPLPGGGTAPSCLPVNVTPQVMYATSTAISSTVVITLNVDTGTNVMRMRAPSSAPLRGYIIDDGGSPAMVIQLELYMDAPDMSILLSDHDLHSKPVSLNLKGPVSFLPDGRIVISLANVNEVPVSVFVDTPLGDGNIHMVLPVGEMKLRLVSNLLRGGE